MAFQRRSGQRFTANVWPGFVDAMTALLLVLMFVLSIFMIVQFILSETISDQDDELTELGAQVASLAQALGLEQQRAFVLEGEIGDLRTTLSATTAMNAAQSEAIAQLQSEATALEAQITGFEAQVAGLLAERADLTGALAAAQGEITEITDAREALQLALAQARTEVDAQAEAARLDAARREALESLVADLRATAATQTATLAQTLAALEGAEAEAGAARTALAEANTALEAEEAARLAELAAAEALRARLSDAQEALTAEETARLAEAAAAQALRDRLANADTELTAMTLALEEQRQAAEDTLTLLAAAEQARRLLGAELAASLEVNRAVTEESADLQVRLAAAVAARLEAETAQTNALSEAEVRARLLAEAQTAIAEADAETAAARREQALLNQQVSALRAQLGSLQTILDEARARDEDAQVQLENLGSELNAALAQVASEQRRRADLEAAERARLEAEAVNLERFRSEFFGRLRDLLEGQDGIRIEGDRFVFSSEVLFPAGSDRLSAEGEEEIAKVAALLGQIASDIPADIDWVLQVDGHTDNIPLIPGARFANNWELSQARALSVVLYLTDQLGLPPERLSANGFGEYQPVNPSDTPEARAQNRRIELKFTEK